MSTKQLVIAIFATALVVSACTSGPAPTPASSAAPTSAASAAPATDAPSVAPSTAASQAPATSAASAAPTGTTAPTAAGACTPEAPTATSKDWNLLEAHNGEFTFKYPPSWDKLYGAFVFKTKNLLATDTFNETGLPADSETRADLVRTPGAGLPNASALVFPGVVSNTATAFQRQVDRLGKITTIKLINTNLAACIGGEPAFGVEFTFNKDATYQQSWFMVRAGRLFDFQWLAAKGQEQTDLFREMFRTWQWTPNLPVATPLPRPSVTPPPSAAATTSGTPTPVPSTGGQPFVLAGMALNVDTAATAANPKDFVTTIPKESTAIYAVFVLKAGLSGQVDGALKQGDKVLVTLSLQYGPKNTWGDFRINAANGIAVGDYTMVITYAPTGESVSVPFSVT